MLSSSTDAIKCPICFEPYNLTLHLPRNITTCGHTICVTCLTEILRFPGNFRCPIDNQVHFFTQKTLEAFPTNFALRDIIEERSRSQLCPKHHRELEFVCMNEKIRLCSHCVLFEHNSDRKLHEIKPISALSGQAKESVAVLEALLKDLDEEKKEARKRLARKKAEFTKLFRGKFDELAFLLRAKEKEMESAIEAVFQREEARIDTIVGGKAEIRKKITNRINGCQDLGFAEEPFKVLSGDHEDLAEEIDDINLEAKLDGMEGAIEEAYLELGDTLEHTIKHVEELEFRIADMSTMIDEVYEEEFDTGLKLLGEMPIKSEAFAFETPAGLVLGSPGALRIREKANAGGVANFRLFDISQADKIHTLSLALVQPQTPKLSPEDLKTLSYVRTILHGLQNLVITTYYQEIRMSFETFKEIFYALFWRASCLQSIDLSLPTLKSIGDQEIKFISENLFQKAVSLKRIRLNIGFLQLGSESVQGLLRSMAPLAEQLESFDLHLDKLDIQEEVFCEILVPMGNIKMFKLSVKDTVFGDRALMDLVANIFRWMSKATFITLDFSGTRVTGGGIKELLLKLPKRLYGFRLTLERNILIQDECLEYFVRHKLAKMEQLRYFSIGVEGTSVSRELQEEIQQIKPAIGSGLGL